MDQKLLLEYFEYKDGKLYRKIVPKHSRANIGELVTGTKKHDYFHMKIQGSDYLVHRVVF